MKAVAFKVRAKCFLLFKVAAFWMGVSSGSVCLFRKPIFTFFFLLSLFSDCLVIHCELGQVQVLPATSSVFPACVSFVYLKHPV